MHCKFCRSWNADDEHRCHRCGRRLKAAPGAQSYPASRSAAALALDELPSAMIQVDQPAPLRGHAAVPQKLRFEEITSSNVIPFESIAAHRGQPVPSLPVAAPASPRTAMAPPVPRQQAPRRSASPKRNDLQPGLDFLVPPPPGPRTLKTQVEAVIYCDAAVAAPKHRAIAAALDGGMIFIGFGIFLLTFHLMGGMFHLNRQTIPFFIGVFGTLVMFYGILWIWAGRETLGMRWTGLRLIDFDGFPAERRDRFRRALAAGLSFCAGGLGLLWALVDEERLTWHDHMSKTFPTFQESDSPFFRKP